VTTGDGYREQIRARRTEGQNGDEIKGREKGNLFYECPKMAVFG